MRDRRRDTENVFHVVDAAVKLHDVFTGTLLRGTLRITQGRYE